MAGIWHDWERLTEFLEAPVFSTPPEGADFRGLLLNSVLVYSFALVETAAADHLGIGVRELGRIERWGTTLLDEAGSNWSNVDGTLYGAVEVAVVRNALAHGQRKFDAQSIERLEQARANPHPVPQELLLDHAKVLTFRNRLLSLVNEGGIGQGAAFHS